MLHSTVKMGALNAPLALDHQRVDLVPVGSCPVERGQPSTDERQAASAFELELNNEKSGIFSTATRHYGGWKQEVRAYVPSDSMDTSEFLRFFYRVGRICEAHPGVNVEKYALSNARAAFVNADGWKTIQSHLIAAYRRNASLISFLVEIMILRQAKRRDVDTTSLAEFISHRLPFLAEKNRTGLVQCTLASFGGSRYMESGPMLTGYHSLAAGIRGIAPDILALRRDLMQSRGTGVNSDFSQERASRKGVAALTT
jgi:hypothetical protein